MKPEKFSGATSVETFFIQFGVCAKYNAWSDADKAAHLKCCLTGGASQVLWEDSANGEMTFAELEQKLRARYGSAGLYERFAAELRGRRRRNNEGLAELHADIKRLMALAYPDSAHTSLGQIIARDHFITALNDREFELRVRDRDPCDLEAAFKAAIRVEMHLKAYEEGREREPPARQNRNRRDRFEENRVRQVARPVESQNNRQPEAADPSVSRLCAQLERAQFEKDELSKELGAFKIVSRTDEGAAAGSAQRRTKRKFGLSAESS